MKKRILGGALVALVTTLMASACDDGGYSYERGGDDYDYGCRRFTSCGTCTPVDGCGWCQTGVGKGLCAADPDECAGATAFSWTWDPSGCTATPAGDADAGGVTIVDSGTSSVRTDDDASTSVDATPIR
jgi:hypothetical protein